MKGTARLIRVWGSGQLGTDILEPGESLPHDGALTVVLERAADVDRARDTGLIGAQTRVFVPGVCDSSDGPVMLGYDGSLSDPGYDVQIGTQFFLQTQDYGTSEYLSLIGATLIRVVDEHDFTAFLNDADTAYTEGSFADFVTHPMVRVCDAAALGAIAADDGPRLRLYVGAEGTISISPAGAPLGELGDDLVTLVAAFDKINGESTRPCAVALAGVVPEASRVAGLKERPWIARYHGAVAAIRGLRAREITDGRDVRVSGFGGRFAPDLQDAEAQWDLGQEDAPLLCRVNGEDYLYSAASERVFRVPAQTSLQVEALLAYGSPEQAAAAGSTGQLTRISDYFESVGVPLCG
ncbi:daptide biosynthesis RiPP recognition protein [Rhizomonospora bruguierae]|uniref:daptide biosynthesis RiPP recognition protein n=1 Tax=Rhizomonospora bruguierae TaxID=1581705 RepID=UPI001BCB252E|nr:daptide biosynthesis RiPP recognition protein [Micromonospora sp. NBRC 107566]